MSGAQAINLPLGIVGMMLLVSGILSLLIVIAVMLATQHRTSV
jgi:hypothetical protein